MCGRYYVDDDTAREIEKLVRQVDEKMRGTAAASRVEIMAKDIHPTETAPILTSSGCGLECQSAGSLYYFCPKSFADCAIPSNAARR